MEPTQELIQEWKLVFAEYKSLLQPNKKGISEVIQYLKQKYQMKEDTSEKAKQVVISNITMNEVFSAKIPRGKELRPIVFSIVNEEKGKKLYEEREEVFRNCPIMIGMEFETGCNFVEGSSELADEMTAFQGLDKDDLNNYYLVANYIRCLKKYGILETFLNKKI
ncbi:hypothetical protein EDC19_1824 [Natranaerovirga hydrolytica]|uniref:Uncharacterized protein n=1 Tax=Natranaerovirga hydrolytica TaxID=680378 RepID=A0A4V2Q079_9FIRM|nr:hypothetical protein [Natranaerovirga hydrolytica]TCK92671.1 hypothetical protein EDC19_1824 [Natranaerovirga hydrolytica]